MLGFYNYTVILTYFGTIMGFSGIICVLAENRKGALACLMIAGVCDMFDGKIASTRIRTREERSFGVQIDSLSDLVCFGILPALIVYTSGTCAFRFIPVAVYVLCALIRLAWFNVDEEERQNHESGSRKVYYGLPVTAAALILPLTMGVCSKWNCSTGWYGSAALIGMAAAFLIPFEVKKPKLSGKISLLLIGFMMILAALTGGMDV